MVDGVASQTQARPRRLKPAPEAAVAVASAVMTRDATPRLLSLRPDHPDFLDLPWGLPVAEWTDRCERVEELPRGASRHPVGFVSYDAGLYRLKGLPPQ